MRFKILKSSPLKDKYFYRTERWDWLTREMIHVFDSKSPKVITMDYWPQRIYLEALGQRTVSEFVYFIASEYPEGQVPEILDAALIEEITSLVTEEKIMALSDVPVTLDASILNPLTEEGEADMAGTWVGTYTYHMPEQFKDEKTREVTFTITIGSVNRDKFEGTVEDDLSTGGTPGIGKIQGRFNSDEVSFEKKMPVYARIEKDGSHTVDKKRKHPTILYKGEFSRSKQHISGTWRFKKKVLVWKGIIPFFVIPGQGYFKMKKSLPLR